MLLNVRVISLMRHVTILHVCFITVVECLVVERLGGVRLVHFQLVDLSGRSCVRVRCCVRGRCCVRSRCCVWGVHVMLGVACSIVCELLGIYVLMLWVAVMCEGVICVTDRLKLTFSIVVRITSVLYSVCRVADQRSVIPVSINIGRVVDWGFDGCSNVMSSCVDNRGLISHSSVLGSLMDYGSVVRDLVHDGCVVRGLLHSCCMMRGLVRGCYVMRSLVRGCCVMRGLVRCCLMRCLVRCCLLRCLVRCCLMCFFLFKMCEVWGIVHDSNVVRNLMNDSDMVWGLVDNGSVVCHFVDNLVVQRVCMGKAIVVVHLEDKVTILNIYLTCHEERGVVLETPIVAGVPFFSVERVEVIPPFQIELFLILIIIVDLDKVILGIPRHLSVIEKEVPGVPARSPEVHHQLSGHVEEVHVLLTLALAHKLVIDVPADVVRGPFDGVSEPISARVESSGVIVVLLTVLPDNVHGEGVFSHRWHDLNIDLVPAMRPILCRIGEERLDSAHFHGVLHLSYEFTVVEPFLRTDFT